MKHVPFTILAASTSLVFVAMACATNDSTERGSGADVDASLPDGSAQPEQDASSAADDAGIRVDGGDAGVSACTSEGWCHTAVPAGKTFTGVWGDGHGTVWAISLDRTIFRWDGATWSSSYAATSALWALWGSSPTDLWVGTEKGLLHGTGPDAAHITWTEVVLPEVDGSALGVSTLWGASGTEIWAVATRTQGSLATYVLHGTRAGAGTEDVEVEWKVDPSTELSSVYPQALWGSGSDDVWLSAYSTDPETFEYKGKLFRRRPDGAGGTATIAWRESANLPPVNSWFTGQSLGKSVVVLNSATGYGEVEGVDVGVSDDDGETFTWQHGTFTSLPYGAFRKASLLWGSSLDDLWATPRTPVGSTWLVQSKDLEASSWRVASISLSDAIPVTNQMNAIWGSGPNDIWVVGQELALHKIDPTKGTP